jgi:hypothetical protein
METIPAELRDFILRHIDSVAQLEALLLLRAHAGQTWTAETLASRLYIAPDQAIPLVESMRGDGFIESVGEEEFRYQGGSPDQRQLIDRLADLYVSHLVAVSNLIHSKPRRIREFAKAFRLKKD